MEEQSELNYHQHSGSVEPTFSYPFNGRSAAGAVVQEAFPVGQLTA